MDGMAKPFPAFVGGETALLRSTLLDRSRPLNYFNPSFLAESKKMTEAYFEHFWIEAAAQGWTFDHCLLNYSEYRYLSS
uniref:Root UVB sensitive protein C-terminal domain-containing protein n=1 Tax=Romanomermis culicivorax TaxID=13658 RepID=A0A915KWF3_ROMCU